MSALWVKCLDCGQQFDIENSIRSDYRCPVCHSRFFEVDNDDSFDAYFLIQGEY
jgi:Zn finger protein HypA/HybF involved in hydrogenase expression